MLPSLGIRDKQNVLWQTVTYICGKRADNCPVSCTCRLPNSKFCILREKELLLERDEKLHRKPKSWVTLAGDDVHSSTTPTVPFSTADLLYNASEVSRPPPSADDFSATDLLYFDHRDKEKHKLRDIETNRRPSSRNNSRRSISLEKVNFDGEKEELRPIKNTFPSTKQNTSRTNGVRGPLLRTDQILNHKNNVSLQGREADDLVAMGTIWSPNSHQRNSTTTTSTTTSSKSFSLSSSSNTSNVNPRKGPSAPIQRSSFTQQPTTINRLPAKDIEPKYTDPVVGAFPSFQQRLMELSALEAETVRWERTKKVKKKSKQDRDS